MRSWIWPGIGGILLLAYELRQNNDLMEAEARLNRTNMAIDAWRLELKMPNYLNCEKRRSVARS